jgi:tRNA threonylcarbamoyladenosine biosynthesis protein TsaE
MEHVSKSLEDTNKIAFDFSKNLKGGDVIFLIGDLGSGKTTFVQAVTKSLGYEDNVTSPTFSIMNIYPIENEKIKTINHFDLYRIEEDSELHNLDLEEYLNSKESVTFIEWPKNKVETFIKSGYNEIKFEQIDSNTRKITIIK